MTAKNYLSSPAQFPRSPGQWHLQNLALSVWVSRNMTRSEAIAFLAGRPEADMRFQLLLKEHVCLNWPDLQKRERERDRRFEHEAEFDAGGAGGK